MTSQWGRRRLPSTAGPPPRHSRPLSRLDLQEQAEAVAFPNEMRWAVLVHHGPDADADVLWQRRRVEVGAARCGGRGDASAPALTAGPQGSRR
jgi:hypothetical protein